MQIYLSTYIFIYLPIYVYLPIYLSTYLFIYLPTYLSIQRHGTELFLEN